MGLLVRCFFFSFSYCELQGKFAAHSNTGRGIRQYVSVIYCTSRLVLGLITGLPLLIGKSVTGSLIIHWIAASDLFIYLFWLLSLSPSIPILIFSLFFYVFLTFPDFYMKTQRQQHLVILFKYVSLRLKHGLSMFKSFWTYHRDPCSLFPLIYICSITCGFENQPVALFWSQWCP